MTHVPTQDEVLRWTRERPRLDENSLSRPFPQFEACEPAERQPNQRNREQSE